MSVGFNISSVPEFNTPEEYDAYSFNFGISDLLDTTKTYTKEQARSRLINRLKKFKTSFNKNINPNTPLFDLNSLEERFTVTAPLWRYVTISLKESMDVASQDLNTVMLQLKAVVDAIYSQIHTQCLSYRLTAISEDGTILSTTFDKSKDNVLLELRTKFNKIFTEYDTGVPKLINVTRIEFSYVLNDTKIALGDLNPIPLNYDDYFEINPRTINNCLFISLYAAMHPLIDYVEDHQKLSVNARKWKQRLKLPEGLNDTPCVQHLAVIANRISRFIRVVDDDLRPMYVFGDPIFDEVLIKIKDNHASALIPKLQVVADILFVDEVEPHIYTKSSKSHLIPPAKKHTTTNTKLAAWDIETQGDEFNVYMVGLAFKTDKIITKQFTRTSLFQTDPLLQLMEYLEASPHLDNYVFYAHNGGKFDVVQLMQKVVLKYPKYKILSKKAIELNNAWISIGITVNGLTFWFKDSYRILPASLKDLTKEFNVIHSKLDSSDMEEVLKLDEIDAWGFINKHQDKLLLYNLHDCLGLLEVVVKFQDVVFEKFKLDVTKFNTAASLSKAIFLSNYYDHVKNPVYTNDNESDKTFRQAYWGGRNECFSLGLLEGPLYYWDFTSLYPYCGTFALPYGVPTNFNDIKDLPKNRATILKVRMRTTDKSRLPMQCHLYDSKLCFPVLNSWTEKTITGVEYEFGVYHKLYEYELIEGWYWTQKAWLKEFFTDLFEMKKKASIAGDTASKFIWKIILNSGYGNWGFVWQDKDSVEFAPTGSLRPLKYIEQGRLIDYKDDGFNCIMRLRSEIRANCNVAVAAYITAYARIRLFRVMDDIITAGFKVHYCDTDSIVTNLDLSKHYLGEKWKAEGYSTYDGEELGSLKNEVPRKHKIRSFDSGIIAGCKMYSLSKSGQDSYEVNKLKGYQKSKSLSGEVIRTLLTGSVTQTQTSIITNKASYIDGFKMSIRKIEKSFRMLYTKGTITLINDLQYSIKPLVID